MSKSASAANGIALCGYNLTRINAIRLTSLKLSDVNNSGKYHLAIKNIPKTRTGIHPGGETDSNIGQLPGKDKSAESFDMLTI